MARDVYAAQVALLVRLLPFIAQEEVFALKGGTAINLFYRICRAFQWISTSPTCRYASGPRALPTSTKRSTGSSPPPHAAYKLDARRIEGGGGGATRIRARLDGAEVKIETSPVTRGVVHDPEKRTVSPTVEDEFGFASIQVVSFEGLVQRQASRGR
ncbi:nucleotidyl transferase AbiEii/AbiGii toxin family protein [Mesorhizobium captivum]|uniref:nucleotidyl transferase AbiEii/AbiGii toxin family protein n=1 Tax=Mesorhizobium captivum TaxID=3072319 RepID=UPI003D313FD6